jgi:Holliday junction resolvase
MRTRVGYRDANEPAIIDALLRSGWSVARVSAKGVPDLIIGKAGVTGLVEVKQAKGRFRQSQLDFQREWRGGPIAVLRTVDQAVRLRVDDITLRKGAA